MDVTVFSRNYLYQNLLSAYLHFLPGAATRHIPVVGVPLFFRTCDEPGSSSLSMRRVLAHLLFCSLETFVRVPRFFLVTWFESASRSFARETGDCVADDARRASPMKRAELSAAATAGSSLPTFPLLFFLPRYLRLPDICTHHAAEARLSPCRRERGGRHTYMPRLLCTGECEASAHRRVTQPHDIFTDSMKTYLSFVSFRFFPPSPLPPPFLPAFSIDR